MLDSEQTLKLMRVSPFFRKTPGGYASPFDERGFEIGEGWFYIVLWLGIKIKMILSNTTMQDKYKCSQIKQKMGELCVYYDGPAGTFEAQEIDQAISEARTTASATCEVCRAPGKPVVTGSYLWVACPEHSKGRPSEIKRHVWDLEEVDGGNLGVADFYICHGCGAAGGPCLDPSVPGPSFPPFVSGRGSEIALSIDCNVAKRQIEELKGSDV